LNKLLVILLTSVFKMRNDGFEMLWIFRLFYAEVVTKFVGVCGHKVPFRMMYRYASRFLGV